MRRPPVDWVRSWKQRAVAALSLIHSAIMKPRCGPDWGSAWVKEDSGLSPVLEKLTVSHQAACWEHARAEAALECGRVTCRARGQMAPAVISAEGDGDLGRRRAWLGGKMRGILMAKWMRTRRERKESTQGPSDLESTTHEAHPRRGDGAGSCGLWGCWVQTSSRPLTDGSEPGLQLQSGQHCMVTETIW